MTLGSLLVFLFEMLWIVVVSVSLLCRWVVFVEMLRLIAHVSILVVYICDYLCLVFLGVVMCVGM